MAFGRRRVAAAVCVLPLVLAGCAGDPEPKLAPPSETPTTESPSSSAAPTREPWEKKTNAGAVAFAKHWIAVFNEAQRTGDTDEMRALSAESCGSCTGFARMLEDLYGNGGRLESEGWRVRHAVPAHGLPPDAGRVSMRIERSAQVVRYGDGQPDERFAKSEVTLSARLVWTDAVWRMSDLVALE